MEGTRMKMKVDSLTPYTLSVNALVEVEGVDRSWNDRNVMSRLGRSTSKPE